MKRVTVRGAEIHTLAERKDFFPGSSWLRTVFLRSFEPLIGLANVPNASLDAKLALQLLHLPRFKESYDPTQAFIAPSQNILFNLQSLQQTTAFIVNNCSFSLRNENKMQNPDFNVHRL